MKIFTIYIASTVRHVLNFLASRMLIYGYKSVDVHLVDFIESMVLFLSF